MLHTTKYTTRADTCWWGASFWAYPVDSEAAIVCNGGGGGTAELGFEDIGVWIIYAHRNLAFGRHSDPPHLEEAAYWRYRQVHATLKLKLDQNCYVEHSDCGERKLPVHIGSLRVFMGNCCLLWGNTSQHPGMQTKWHGCTVDFGWSIVPAPGPRKIQRDRADDTLELISKTLDPYDEQRRLPERDSL